MRPSFTMYFSLLAFLLLSAAGSLNAQSMCMADGGELTLEDGLTTRIVCLDYINDSTINVIRTGAKGDRLQYFITNAGATILRVLEGDPPFSLSEFYPGGILIWSVAYSGGLNDAEVGDNLCMTTSTEGCFDLSNPVIITRFRTDECPIDPADCMAMGGTIELANGNDTTICVDQGPAPLNVSIVEPAKGDQETFIITDTLLNILSIPDGDGPFDLTGAGVGTCLIWHLAYDETLDGLEVGGSVNDLTGCYALSNPIRVNRVAGPDCPGFVPPMTFTAVLNGQQELPCPVTTTGRGQVSATLDGNTLTVNGSFSMLSSDFDASIGGGAHLHTGLAGMGGPVILPLSSDLDDDLRGGSFSAEDNVFELTDEQVATVKARGLYVNIHTQAYPGGEIRGQLLMSDADAYAMAVLSGAQENPSVITDGYGGVAADLVGNRLTVSGSFAGLGGTIATQIGGGAHIHLGIAGQNGPVIFPLTMNINDDQTGATFPAADNVFELSDAQVDAFNSQMLYVNIHSSMVASGEIRGQLLPYSVATFYAEPSGHQARPVSINTTGNGKLLLSFYGVRKLTVSGSVNDLMSPIATQIAGGGHLHLGVTGRSGPVSFPLSLTLNADSTGAMLLPADNTFTLTPEQVEAFYDRGYYSNFHTEGFPSGEIRGQVLNLAKQYFGSNLAGINSNPDAVKTPGNGFVLYENCDDQLKLVGSFADLSSDYDPSIGSHLHLGDAAGTGPVFQPLTVDLADDSRAGVYRADDNCYTLEPNQLDALRNGGVYFNLHTLDYPAGEIRGQVLNDDDRFPTEPTIIAPAPADTVMICDDSTTSVTGIFSSSTDPDGDLVVYTTEVTLPQDSTFSSVLTCRKLGTDTTATFSGSEAYDILTSLGLTPGEVTTLRFRVVASDGSVATPGPGQLINFLLKPVPPPCEVDGGMIALDGGATDTTICINLGPAPLDVVVTEEADAETVTFLITDANGNILSIPAGNGPFDLSGAGAGTCLIWQLAYDGELTGLEVGASANDLEGCFDLSNPITVNRQDGGDGCEPPCEADGGAIALNDGNTEITLCFNIDPTTAVQVYDTEPAVGDSIVILVTDLDGTIILTLSLYDMFTIGTDENLTVLVWQLAYNGDITGLERGAKIGDLMGCFDLSDPLTVNYQNGGEGCEPPVRDTFSAVLNGLQELPCPITTTGYGTAELVLTDSVLTVTGNFGGLTSDFDPNVAGGAHIHLGNAGTGGPILFPLVTDLDDDERGGSFSAPANTFVLSPGQIDTLRAYGLYLNIHTEAYPGGEIRGQVLPGTAEEYYHAVMLGSYENPTVVTNAAGGIVVRLQEEDSTITVSGGFSGLMGEIATDIAGGAHIHTGLAGTNGPVIFPLTMDIDDNQRSATFAGDENTFQLDSAQLAALRHNGLYINIHSTLFPSGEIRGQIAPYNRLTSFLAQLSGHQERPEPVNTPAHGTIMVDVMPDGDSIVLSGSFAELTDTILTSLAGGAHLHLGETGSSGPVVFPIGLSIDNDQRGADILPDTSNTFAVDSAQLSSFYDRGYYANIHTPNYRAGEIRGQVLHIAKAYFGSALNGLHSVPSVTTTGNGFMLYEYDINKLTAVGSFQELTSDYNTNVGSHLHLGNAASTGPVTITLDADLSGDLRSGSYDADSNMFVLTDMQTDALVTGGLYFNLHTLDYPAGEIRGQVLRHDDAFPTASMVTSPMEGDTIKLFLDSTNVDVAEISSSTDPDGDLVVYKLVVASADDDEFTEPLLCLNLGTDTVFTDELLVLYEVLISQGLEEGDAITLNYRIISSDGSLDTPSETQTTVFTIGDTGGGLARPVINEITATGEVEFLNKTDNILDFSDYILYRNGNAYPVTDLQVMCGGLLVKPGDLLTVKLPGIEGKGGEVALFSMDEQANTNDLVSFVSWGVTDPSFEMMAVEFGLWSEDIDLAGFTTGVSLQRIPSNQTSVYAFAKPTICDYNTLSTSTTQPAADLLLVYPNPVSNELTVEYAGLRSASAEVQVIDMTGRLLLERQVESRNGRLQLATGSLPAGTYTLRLANGAGISVSRFTKR